MNITYLFSCEISKHVSAFRVKSFVCDSKNLFSFREYPCDHYTAVINVTLMNTGCPRPIVRDTALQLLQILDKRFFGVVGPLAEGDLGELPFYS